MILFLTTRIAEAHSGNHSQDIKSECSRHNTCTSELSTLFSVENVCFFSSSCLMRFIHEVKGMRQWRLFYGELSCVDVLVNITIVAVKRLINRSNHDKLTVNCQ